MAIFEAPSYAMIFACFQDEEYERVVVPDEEVRNLTSGFHLPHQPWKRWSSIGNVHSIDVVRMSKPPKKKC